MFVALPTAVIDGDLGAINLHRSRVLLYMNRGGVAACDRSTSFHSFANSSGVSGTCSMRMFWTLNLSRPALGSWGSGNEVKRVTMM